MHNLVLVELLDVEYYRDFEMWSWGHSRSFKSLGVVSFAFHNKYGAILYRLWDIATYW